MQGQTRYWEDAAVTLHLPGVTWVTVTVYCTRRYSSLSGPNSSSCKGLRPPAEGFFALRAKKNLIMLFWPILGHCWCTVVPLVNLSSNLSKFKKNLKTPKKNLKKMKIQKSKKSQKVHKKYIYIHFKIH